MKNKYIFVRHGDTVKDPNIPAWEWALTPNALEKLQDEMRARVFEGASVLITSTEPKAIATARPLEESLSLSVLAMSEFDEIARDKEFLSEEEFARAKRAQLENEDLVGSGGESAHMALERFMRGIEILETTYSDETIVVVTHGTVLALYFFHLHALAHTPVTDRYTYWRAIPFCGIGIVESEIITRDISTL